MAFVGFRAGQVSIPIGGAGMDTGWITAVNGCVAGIVGGHAAVEDGGTGTVGVDTASVNDAMITVAAKLLCGDVVGGVSWLVVATNALLKDGAGVVGAAFNKPADRNVSNMNDGLAVESNERGWALACVTVWVVIGEWAAGFCISNVGAMAGSLNRSGLM